MKIRAIIVSTFLLFNLGISQLDWVKNNGKSAQYPDQLYLTGFGIAKLGKDEDKANCNQVAMDDARKNLIEKIRVNIQSTVRSKTEEVNEKLSSYFSSAIQSSASLEIQGLENEPYYDEDNEVCYALAYVKRSKLISVYDKKVDELRSQIQTHLENGKQYDETGQRTKALEEYLACYPLFRQLEEAEAILTSAETEIDKSFSELEGKVKKDRISSDLVRQAIDRLAQKPINSVDDLAWYLIFGLKNQTDLKDKAILVTPFTYRDTKMGSPLSRFFKQSLENKGIEVAKWGIVQQVSSFQPKTRDAAREYAESSGAEYVLSGTFWEQSNGLKFQATLRQVSNSKLLGSVEAVVPISIITTTNLSLKPQNFKQVMSDQKEFNKDEVIGGGLRLEVWTNRGAEDLLFTKGDTMNVYVRVNMPCYIRFIYHLADGKRALLLDNHYIDESKVNVVYQIPQEFVCDTPYGAEFLQAFARTDKFEPVDTVSVDGNDILKEDLGKFLTTTRGMKKVKKGTMQSEQRIVITTMEK